MPLPHTNIQTLSKKNAVWEENSLSGLYNLVVVVHCWDQTQTQSQAHLCIHIAHV